LLKNLTTIWIKLIIRYILSISKLKSERAKNSQLGLVSVFTITNFSNCNKNNMSCNRVEFTDSQVQNVKFTTRTKHLMKLDGQVQVKFKLHWIKMQGYGWSGDLYPCRFRNVSCKSTFLVIIIFLIRILWHMLKN
jgi:hypothetical protein